MQFFLKTRGNVSIFLIIILVPVIAVCTLFIDVSRVYLAKELATSSADLSLNTVLSQYDTDLEQYYGLMGSCQNIEEFYDVSEEYFKACMMSQGVAETDAQKWAQQLRDIFGGNKTFDDLILIDKDITSAEIINLENANLSNSVVLREQISEFMKYRAPVDIVQDLTHNKGKYSNLLTNLGTTADKAKNVPYETAIQKSKSEYYDAEHALLQKALSTYEEIEEYEKLLLDRQYLDDTRACYEGLEADFKELHQKYLIYWANLDKIWDDNFQSPDSLVGTPEASIEAPETGFTVGDINSLLSTLQEKITNYEQALEAANDVINKNPEIAAVPEGAAVEAQYWIQMEGKLPKYTYENYYKSYIEMVVARKNVELALNNRNTEEETDEVVSPDAPTITKAADDHISEFKTTPIYKTATRMATYCANTRKDTTKEAATKAILAKLKKSTEDPSEKFVERYETIKDGILIVGGDNYKNIVKDAPSTYDGLCDDFIKLKGLVKDYNDKYEKWKTDTNTANGAGIDSPIVDQSNEDIAAIEGTGENKKKLERLDITEQDCENMANYCARVVELLRSYLDCAEDLKYEDTQIMGKKLTDKCSKGQGIYDFESFKKAIHNGSDNALSTLDEDESAIPVNKSSNDQLAEDTYFFDKSAIEKLIEIDDGGEETTRNSPSFHSDITDPTAATSIPKMERFLHDKFQDHDVSSEETAKWMKNLKKMMKDITKEFTGYDRSAHVSTNEIVGQPDLPSASDDSSSKTSEMMNVSETDNIEDDLEKVGTVAGIFSQIGDFLVAGRDNVYTTDYIMNMFSYETHYMEKMYQAAREGQSGDNIYAINVAPTTIRPANADELFDAHPVGGDTDYLNNTEPDKTYNKSMTNKIIYMMKAGADADKDVNGNNWAYGHEVEYILTGKKKSESTVQLQATLYFIRFALDLAPVFQYYWPDQTIKTIAETISVASCGTIPMPAIQLGIIFGICAAEAAVDRNYLMAGLPVPLIKNGSRKGDNELFISFSGTDKEFMAQLQSNNGSAKSFIKEDKNGKAIKEVGLSPRLSYSDYLSIFVFLELCFATDSVYKRTADVIQVNMDKNPNIEAYGENAFKMKSALTYYQIDTTVRVKPLMITVPYAKEYGTGRLLDNFNWNTFQYKTIEGY